MCNVSGAHGFNVKSVSPAYIKHIKCIVKNSITSILVFNLTIIYLQNGFEIFQAYHVSIGARDIGGRMRATNNTNFLS